MCMDVRAACMCLWDGVGVHAHVYMCVRNIACVYVFVEHRALGCPSDPPDSINLVIIVISCALKLNSQYMY